MLFTSFDFFKLVTVTFALYYIPFLKRYQVYLLIVSSLIFYASHKPSLLLLLLSTILINFYTVRQCLKTLEQNKKKLIATVGVLSNLLILFFFKYASLLGQTLASANQDLGEFLISIPLPIGISFYTFQGISLMLDTYKNEHSIWGESQSTIGSSGGLNIMLFISFFPQLVAGPIVKAREFIPQISTKVFSAINWRLTIKALITGYFLKSVIADNLKDHTFWIAYPYFLSKSSTELLFMLFGYSMQIFADFAGYSLIAIGIGKLFGYELPKNFNFPYISRSFSEFWTRWHISLSSFLREYLYIPLGGNKKGKYRTYINLFLTMTLGGFWHGAAWSYAIWGFAHGILLAIERLLGLNRNQSYYGWADFAKIPMIFIFVTWAWILFKLPDFNQVILFHQTIANNFHISSNYSIITYILIYSLPIIVYHIFYIIPFKDQMSQLLRWVEPIILAIMLFLIITNSGTSTDFIYFQF